MAIIASMDVKAISELDGQIRKLEKELSALYHKRVGLLEAELRRSQGLIGAFGGSSPASPSSPVEAPTLRAPATKRTRTKPAKTKIPRAKAPSPAKEKSAPAQEAPAPKEEIAPPQPKTVPAKAAARKPKQAGKRTRTPTAVVEKRIFDALKDAGLFGLSQIEVSQKTGLGYQTVVKKLKELEGIEKKGSGKEGRFYLKG